jgi:polygalacturonase
MCRRNRARWWWLGCVVTATSGVQAQVYNVRGYGATGNVSTLDSPAINAPINVCHSAGGGTVHFPSGMYLTGPLRLKPIFDSTKSHLPDA